MTRGDGAGPWVRAASTAITALLVLLFFTVLVAGLVCAVRLILWGLGVL